MQIQKKKKKKSHGHGIINFGFESIHKRAALFSRQWEKFLALEVPPSFDMYMIKEYKRCI